jgi:multidrug efflux pump subunit AcrB
MNEPKMGISGRIAAAFQSAQITPLLALVAFLLGVFAVMVTPREEEPQINVTMANVIAPFPGASVREVEQMVAIPAEQVLSKIAGVEHVYSVSRPGVAIMTVQFKVGVPRTEALVKLHDTIRENADWLPRTLGLPEPLIKPKGIDDVPIVTLTLHGSSPDTGAYELERVAHSIEADIKRVPGTRDVQTLGGPGRAVLVQIDPQRMTSSGVSVIDLRAALQSANLGLPVGELITANKSISIDAGPYLSSASEVAELMVGVREGKPVFLKDLAKVQDGPPPAQSYVWHGQSAASGRHLFPASR